MKTTKKELLEYKRLHDKSCQSCDGCLPPRKIKGKLYLARCSFTEGYKRGQDEIRQTIKEALGLITP